MKKLFLLCLILVVMAAAISGLHGCTSAGFDYYSGSGKDYSTSGKDYPTYDYQGNRLEQNEGEAHQNRGY